MAYNDGDYNRAGLNIFAFSIITTVVFFIYVSLFMGVKIDEVQDGSDKGTGTETAVEQKQATGENIDKFNPSAVKEPWVGSPELIAHGKSIYATNCAMCHGPEGHGDGVASKGVVPPPRNLVEGKWMQGGSQVGLFKVITEGVKGTSMVSWAQLSEVDRWGLVHFIQSITKNKIDKPDELKAFIASQK